MKKTQKPKLISYLQTFLDFSKGRKTFADLLMCKKNFKTIIQSRKRQSVAPKPSRILIKPRAVGNSFINGQITSNTNFMNIRNTILANTAYSHITATAVDPVNDG